MSGIGAELAAPVAGRAAPSARLSALLGEAARLPGARVALNDLLALFGHRAFGALIAVLAAPNALPVAIPGLSFLVGLPLILLTAQLVAGRPAPWLPAALRVRSIARADFERMTRAMAKPLARLERVLRPRLAVVTAPAGERVLGLLGLAMAVALFLPLPFGNMLPGLGLTLIGLALLERDGLAALAGVVVGLTGFGIAFGAGVGVTIAVALALLDALQ